MNTTLITGRVVRNPEQSTTQDGRTQAALTVAVDRPFKPKDAKYPESDFYYCIAFGKTAEFILEHFSKGKAIGMSLSYRQYKNKENKTSHFFLVDRVNFLPRDREEQNFEEMNNHAYPEDGQEIDVTDDDLPF